MASIIHTPTNNLQQSLEFYTRLGFHSITTEDAQFVSDGQCLIEINPDRFARAGVKLLKGSWEKELPSLEKLTSVKKIEDGFLLGDPNGVRIYLINGEPTNLDISQIPHSILGNFAGLSLESTDLQRTITLWETIGFSKTMGGIEQGWIAFQNEDGLSVSLMQPNTCPHLFFNPSLTYFNGKNNQEVIQKIRKTGIPITEEITHFNKEGVVDNIIIRDPGGYGFFVFSD